MKYLLSLCVVVPGPLFAQPAREAPLDARYLRDHAQTRGFMLGRPVRAQPTPDGKAVLFLRSQARSGRLSLFEYDIAGGKTRELVTPQQLLGGAAENLSAEEKARRERMRVSAGGFTSYQLSEDGNLVLLSLSGRLFVHDRAAGKSRELNTGPGALIDPRFSPDGTKVAYVRDHDVYVLDLAAQKEQQLTKDGTALVSHGLAEFIAQEEMSRFSGYWWSPDSRHIAYQETDNRGVEVWHVADPIRPGDKPTPFYYPRPGKANAKVRLGVVGLEGGATRWLDWDRDKYPYLATVRWPKDGPLLLAVQNRAQTELVLLEADPASGKTHVLLVERDPAWVNLHQEFPAWLDNQTGFLWTSERDGSPQLELRSRSGRMRRVLVPAGQGFRNLVAVERKAGQIVYDGGLDPTQLQLFRVGLAEGSEPEALTKDVGLHSAAFSRDHSLYVHTARLLSAMPVSTVRRGDGTMIGTLPSVAEEPPFEPRVELVEIGMQGFRAAVVWPRQFDANKRYPVLLDVYGGPHHLHVQATRSRWLLDQWYADQGFIVVAIDGRGTPGRTRDWERAIKNKFSSVPLDDQVEGLLALGRRYRAMDLKRVGIDGWSFGGYMAALAVLSSPDVFSAGVAGAPVTEWLDYDTHYTERYLGIPPGADAVYKENSLLPLAGSAKRPLLLLHGTADDNVYFRHSLRLVDRLFRAGKDFEVLPLSGLTHMVPDPQVMEALHSRIARFLRKHLGTPQ